MWAHKFTYDGSGASGSTTFRVVIAVTNKKGQKIAHTNTSLPHDPFDSSRLYPLRFLSSHSPWPRLFAMAHSPTVQSKDALDLASSGSVVVFSTACAFVVEDVCVCYESTWMKRHNKHAR
jgi:hypothetical protein